MKPLLSGLSNLQQRILVGVLGIGLFLGLIFSGLTSTLILFALLIALCLNEFYSLSPFPIPFLGRIGGIGAGLVLFYSWVLSANPVSDFDPKIFLGLVPLSLTFLLFSKLEKPFETLSWIVFGWAFLISPWICLFICLEDFPFQPGLLLGLFFLLWAADTGAYAAGRTLGKTKLLPRVSPKKTWEGLAGGIVLSCLAAWLFHGWVGCFTLGEWLTLAVSTTIFGTLGDLAESVLKRSLDLKDSGNLLPGHGGILDRFDGLFLAAPVNALLVHFIF